MFVANRIAIIHAYSGPHQWRNVDSASNLADVFSRGLHPRDFTASQSYLSGPGFLLGDESDWPVLPLYPGSKTCGLEEIVSCVAATTSDDSLCNLSNDSLYQLFLRYSVLQRLVRVIAWLLRFLKWLQHRFFKSRKCVDADTGSASELHVACECAVKIAQHQTFPDVAVAVEAHGWRDTVKGVKENRCKQQLKSLSKLCPIADNGVLRVGGKLQRGNLPFELKHPAILLKRHPVTKLLVLNTHVQTGHVGIQHVLSILRYRYWIMGGAATIKHYVFECMQCRNLKAVPGAQVMSPLPDVRIEPGQRAFYACGVDLFGNFFVRVGRSSAKRCSCIFTCLASRAVHLELVESLSTDAFLGAFFRILCARGFAVKHVFSDNGTNFHGAVSKLSGCKDKTIDEGRVLRYVASLGIE